MLSGQQGTAGGKTALHPGGLGKISPLTVQCRVDAATGKITRKTEVTATRRDFYDYEYDADGRLFRVFRNELLQERYLYTGIGQREVKSNGWANESVKYFYGGDGCLYMAASVPAMIRFAYDAQGNLTLREEGQRQTTYVYKDTRLQQVILPDGGKIHYLYNQKGKNPVGPVAKYHGPARKENLAMEYVWRDMTRLASCFDHHTKMRYDFVWDESSLVRIRLRGHAVSRLLRTNANDAELFVGCDQVNTPKVFTDRLGREVKYVDYDSFGIILDDTYPELFIPIGFAGGLLDRDTRLVRFGYRDYDPSVGRFTCPDPLGDTGGDHDVYEYCVDDPVNMSDPAGLFPPLLLFLGGMALAGAITGGGTLAAGAIAEGANAAMGDEKNAGKAWGGAKKIATDYIPPAVGVGMAGGAPLIPGGARAAGAAYTHIGQKAGAAIQASRHGEKVIKGTELLEGALNPNAPTAPTVFGLLGTGAVKAVEHVQKEWKKKK